MLQRSLLPRGRGLTFLGITCATAGPHRGPSGDPTAEVFQTAISTKGGQRANESKQALLKYVLGFGSAHAEDRPNNAEHAGTDLSEQLVDGVAISVYCCVDQISLARSLGLGRGRGRLGLRLWSARDCLTLDH